MKFTEEELKAFRAEYAKGATDSQFSLFIAECEARNLRPGPHLVFQLRNAKEWDATVGAKVFVKKPYWITTVSALRLIAQRTGEYLGQGPGEFIYLDKDGNPSVTSEIPLPDPEDKRYPRVPWVVRTKVYRKGFAEPMIGLARFDAYAGTMTVNNETVLTDMWSKRGPEQLQKCSEALALRKAFSEELGSLYLAEEIKDEETNLTPSEVTPASSIPLPPPAPAVNQVPAVGTETPRPNEPVKVEYHTDKVPATLPEHSGTSLVVAADSAATQIPAVSESKPSSTKEKKKPGRKPKDKESPENGQDPALMVTDADFEPSTSPAPVFDSSANQKEAKEFVEAVSSFTADDAVSRGLPVPEDPLPDEIQKKDFANRARQYAKEAGVDSSILGAYALKLSDKTSSKYMTVGNWNLVFSNLEKSKTEGNLKELLKGGA